MLTLCAVIQKHLNKHNTEAAIAALIKSCSLSTFTIGVLNEHNHDWNKLLLELDMGPHYYPVGPRGSMA